jgi:leucyl-tRNA synthetase
MYEVFMGPLDQEKFWNDEALPGCYRFLSRVYQAANSEKVCDEDSEQAFKLSHKMASGVRHDLDNLLFNTAIAKMMEFLNSFTKLDKYPKSALKILLQSLHPFAPHISSELWEVLGEKGNISYSTLSKIDEKYLAEDSVTYVVQVNGKVRGKFNLPKGSSKEEILNLAKEHEIIRKHLDGKEIRKTIYVPNKLLNLVV